ncbi:MAG: hypothetical protein NTY67_01320, partial [Cyanobacteria bacterium]|nr:hypothetical protein [Cyanobacteriota bacterium]
WSLMDSLVVMAWPWLTCPQNRGRPIWEHDFDGNSRVLAQVRSMQTGERIAIKAATRRKAGLIDSTDKARRACYS